MGGDKFSLKTCAHISVVSFMSCGLFFIQMGIGRTFSYLEKFVIACNLKT